MKEYLVVSKRYSHGVKATCMLNAMKKFSKMHPKERKITVMLLDESS